MFCITSSGISSSFSFIPMYHSRSVTQEMRVGKASHKCSGPTCFALQKVQVRAGSIGCLYSQNHVILHHNSQLPNVLNYYITYSFIKLAMNNDFRISLFYGVLRFLSEQRTFYDPKSFLSPSQTTDVHSLHSIQIFRRK